MNKNDEMRKGCSEIPLDTCKYFKDRCVETTDSCREKSDVERTREAWIGMLTSAGLDPNSDVAELSSIAGVLPFIVPGIDVTQIDPNGDGKLGFNEFYLLMGYRGSQIKPGQCSISFSKYANSPYSALLDIEKNQCMSLPESECTGDCQWA